MARYVIGGLGAVLSAVHAKRYGLTLGEAIVVVVPAATAVATIWWDDLWDRRP